MIWKCEKYRIESTDAVIFNGYLSHAIDNKK